MLPSPYRQRLRYPVTVMFDLNTAKCSLAVLLNGGSFKVKFGCALASSLHGRTVLASAWIHISACAESALLTGPFRCLFPLCLFFSFSLNYREIKLGFNTILKMMIYPVSRATKILSFACWHGDNSWLSLNFAISRKKLYWTIFLFLILFLNMQQF